MNFSPDNIKSIKNNITMIQKFMLIPDIKLLASTNQDLYKEKMKSIFTSFELNYPSLFELVISGDDLTPLEYMLSTMEKINNGETDKDRGEMSIGDHLATKYVKIDRLPSGIREAYPDPKKMNKKK
jgi:hypothetical protein